MYFFSFLFYTLKQPEKNLASIKDEFVLVMDTLSYKFLFCSNDETCLIILQLFFFSSQNIHSPFESVMFVFYIHLLFQPSITRSCVTHLNRNNG